MISLTEIELKLLGFYMIPIAVYSIVNHFRLIWIMMMNSVRITQ